MTAGAAVDEQNRLKSQVIGLRKDLGTIASSWDRKQSVIIDLLKNISRSVSSIVDSRLDSTNFGKDVGNAHGLEARDHPRQVSYNTARESLGKSFLNLQTTNFEIFFS